MIVLDTDVLIDILNDNQSTIEKIQSFDSKLAISSLTVMELLYGALNEEEVKKLENFFTLFEIININEEISKQSISLIKTYSRSHKLDTSNSLIASTALTLDIPLFTSKLEDFRFINGLIFQLA